MPKPEDKSLDDQLKEAQIAREQAEISKLKAEEGLIEKQTNAKWYSGKSLAKFSGFVLTAVALYSVLDTVLFKDIREHDNRLINLKAEVAQAALDSLNIEKRKITTTIDSLTVRTIISAGFGDLDSLKYANVLEKYNMIKAKNYYDSRLNPNGTGLENRFELQRGDSVVYDAKTTLTWQSGSEGLKFAEAAEFIRELNDQSFASHNDWRLPTLEEAMSLMEPAQNKVGLFIHPVFDETRYIWTSDKFGALRAWYVSFFDGYCSRSSVHLDGTYVRAVR